MSSVGDFLKNLFDSLLSGNFDRKKIIDGLNQAFREFYYSGSLQRLCVVRISAGDPDYRHEMSVGTFRSGFKIFIMNDSGLSESEMKEIAMYVLFNKPFVRRLMALGFDTLYVVSNNTGRGFSCALKNFASLDNFFIQ